MKLTAPSDETPVQWHQGDFTVTCDRDRLDVDAIHSWLSERSYWAVDVPRETVERSLQHSLPFAIYHQSTNTLVGFCRVITDRATLAYLADVFVVEEWRGRGLSKWLMKCVQAHPDLQDLRRWLLVTTDAHGLYRQFGFDAPLAPDKYMERHVGNRYNDSAEAFVVAERERAGTGAPEKL